MLKTLPKGLWETLPQPIIGLSPMDGVTDYTFRHIQKKYGKPSLLYTEFTSVEGVCHGAKQLLEDFQYDETQRPIIAQIYGSTPDYFRQTAIILCELGFDGIDINMGCPAKNVAHSGAGAALIKTPELAQEIIRATQTGVHEYLAGKRTKDCPDIVPKITTEIEKRHQTLPASYQKPRAIPVSIKTRVGYDSKQAVEWVKYLLEENPTAIAIHGRTLKQQYSGEADWEEIARAAEVIHQTDTLVLGNGDINSHTDALEKISNYGVDGVLIGRASFGNPFIFQPDHPLAKSNTLEKHNTDFEFLKPLYKIALEHCKFFESAYQNRERYSFLPMRKHLGWYIKSIPNATEIRAALFQTNTSAEVEDIFKKFELI